MKVIDEAPNVLFSHEIGDLEEWFGIYEVGVDTHLEDKGKIHVTIKIL